jgi:hypothetical protein
LLKNKLKLKTIVQMKKIFIALAISGLFASSTINTISAATHIKVFANGGEEDKCKKDKKEKKCCSKDASASASDKKACSEGKVCSKGEKCCHAKSQAQTSNTSTGLVNPEKHTIPGGKPAEPQKPVKE